MRTITIASLAALLALLLLAGQGLARSPFPGDFMEGHGDHEERFLDAYADRLGLDEETREKIRAKIDASRSASEPLRDQVHDGYRALRELLMQDAPNQDAVMQQAQEVGELRIALAKLRLATLLDVRALLTPEQRAEMIAIHQERKLRFMGSMLEGCAGDLVALCPDTEDPRDIFRCMKEQREMLSEECRDSFRRGHSGRRHERPHGEGHGPPGERGFFDPPPDF